MVCLSPGQSAVSSVANAGEKNRVFFKISLPVISGISIFLKKIGLPII